VLLLVIGGSVTDLGVGVRSAAAAPFRLLQVLEADCGEGQRQTRRIRRSKFDEAKLQRFGQQAGSHTYIQISKIQTWKYFILYQSLHSFFGNMSQTFVPQESKTFIH